MKINQTTATNNYRGLVQRNVSGKTEEPSDTFVPGNINTEKDPVGNHIKDFMKNGSSNAIEFWCDHPWVSGAMTGTVTGLAMSALDVNTGISLLVGLATAAAVGGPGMLLNKITKPEKDHVKEENIIDFVGNHPTASAVIAGGIIGEGMNLFGGGLLWSAGAGLASAAVVGGIGHWMHKVDEEVKQEIAQKYSL